MQSHSLPPLSPRICNGHPSTLVEEPVGSRRSVRSGYSIPAPDRRTDPVVTLEQRGVAEMKAEKLILTVVVNSTQVELEANPNAELRTVVTHALAQTKNSGQPFENWQLADRNGNPLDLSVKVGEAGLVRGSVLFLTPRAGVGG